jgi:hypothetical protein
MKSYRLHGVEIVPTGKLPILLACDKQRADGVALHVASEEEARKLGCVRVVDSRVLTLFVKNPRKFEMEYGSVSNTERGRILGLLMLLGAIKNREDATLEFAINRLATGPFTDWDRRVLEKQPGIELGRRLAEGVRGVEFVLWWKDDRKDSYHLSGLRCPDVLTALYTLAALQMEGGKGLGACVVCGEPFIRVRGTRKTCSGKCRYLLFSQRRRMKSKGRTTR